jgi:hypothetical protein
MDEADPNPTITTRAKSAEPVAPDPQVAKTPAEPPTIRPNMLLTESVNAKECAPTPEEDTSAD